METPILTKPQTYNLTSLQPINLFMAGVGSGKTYLGGMLSMFYVLNFPEVKGMIAANTYMQLTQSTMNCIRDVWRDNFGLIENKDYVVDKKPLESFNTKNHNFDNYYNIVSFWNGAIIYNS